MEKRTDRNMALNRSPFQGAIQIIQFNRHFYLSALVFIVLIIPLSHFLPQPFQLIGIIGGIMGGILVGLSILVSYYIYDYSNLYQLPWAGDFNHLMVLNVTAGFDETTVILKHKYPNIQITSVDFYQAKTHTEKSIERARKIYPRSKDLVQVNTHQLPFDSNTFDVVFAMFSLHEIRNQKEKEHFFRELNRVLKPHGELHLTEHLRNLPNALAYSVGVFHFFSKKLWIHTFSNSGFRMINEIHSTPFVTTFILKKYGHTD